MGSGDLNMKKSWHPQRSGNVAATHKAEAEAIAERKKIQQRLQEIEEERKKEDIQKALEAAGGKRKVDRVEWMYSGPTDGQTGDAAENEAYLLGKRRIDKLLQDNEVKKLSKQADLGAFAEAPALINARDVATKIREDPLLAIKRQEQQAYEAMMNDPIKRRQLLASMGIEDQQSKAKGKEERRHKHRSHHHRPHRHRDDNRDSERHSHRRRSVSRERSRSPRRHDSEEDGRKRRTRDSPSRKRHRSDSDDDSERRHRRRDEARPDSRDGRSSRDRRDSRGRRDRSDGNRATRPRDDRSTGSSRSASPPPRQKDYSLARDQSAPRRRDESGDRDDTRRKFENNRNGDRNAYRPRPRLDYHSRNRDRDQPPRRETRPSRPNNGDMDKEKAEQERARKLAAMQEAAVDLDKARLERLAALEARERADNEVDDRVRQRNKRIGGDAGFTNKLYNKAMELKVADRGDRR